MLGNLTTFYGKHKIIACFIMTNVALLGCSNAVEEASKYSPDITPPEIRATTPINDTIDYGVRGEISVEFNEAMDESTLLTTGLAAFTLDRIQDQTRTTVVGSVNYSSDTYIATYVPTASLPQGGKYVATVNTSAADTSGNRLLEPRQWEFKTTESSGPIWSGTKQLGVAGANADGNGVATDPSGNVFVAGDTNGNLDGNTLIGIEDFFVTKYGADGVKQWTEQLGVADARTVGSSATTDPIGNVFVAGYTSGGLDGNTRTGGRDFFVTKYNTNGVKQ